jgi:hypothetical protein
MAQQRTRSTDQRQIVAPGEKRKNPRGASAAKIEIWGTGSVRLAGMFFISSSSRLCRRVQQKR